MPKVKVAILGCGGMAGAHARRLKSNPDVQIVGLSDVAVPHVQAFIDRAERLRTLTYADVLRGNVLVGTPESVADKLRRLQDEIGFDGILAELNCGGLIPHERVLHALKLLCQEVMPRFR